MAWGLRSERCGQSRPTAALHATESVPAGTEPGINGNRGSAATLLLRILGSPLTDRQAGLVGGQRADTPRRVPQLVFDSGGDGVVPGDALGRGEILGSGSCGAVRETFFLWVLVAQRCQFLSQRIAASTGRLWLPYAGRPMMVRARNPRAIPPAATAVAAHSMMVSTWMTSVSM